jgi:hypothetical protein
MNGWTNVNGWTDMNR